MSHEPHHLIVTDGKTVFVRSTTSFWDGQGHPTWSATKLKKKWVRVDPKEWFDPGTLLSPGSLGKKNCDVTTTVRVGKPTTLQCPVSFPQVSGSHEVRAGWETMAYPTFAYDPAPLATAFDDAASIVD